MVKPSGYAGIRDVKNPASEKKVRTTVKLTCQTLHVVHNRGPSERMGMGRCPSG